MMVAIPQGEQIGVDEVNECFMVEPEARGDDEWDDHGARVEREDVLNAEDGEFPKGRDLIDGVGERTRGLMPSVSPGPLSKWC